MAKAPTAPRKLTPAQWRVLAALAADGLIRSHPVRNRAFLQQADGTFTHLHPGTIRRLVATPFVAGKDIHAPVPHTVYRITEAGRQALHAQEASDA